MIRRPALRPRRRRALQRAPELAPRNRWHRGHRRRDGPRGVAKDREAPVAICFSLAKVYVDTRRSVFLAAERQHLKKAAYEC